MKRNYPVLTVLCAATLSLISGCNKPEEPAPAAQTEAPVVKERTATASNAVNAAVADMQKTAESAAANVQTQAAAVQASADKAIADSPANAASLTSKTQSLIDKVKALLAENKAADALPLLSQLATAKLTPEQQATVDDLKQKAQKLMQDGTAAKAADAVGGFLKKK